MSLFDALVDDAVLSRPVMQQNYYIALRSDGAKGSGTFDDPWNGSTQAMFDAAMTAVPENSTVFLGPAKFNSSGVATEWFETKGYPTNGGFTPKSGQRIVGAGMDVTVIKLVGHTANVQNSAFGMPFATGTDFLNGFELSDLTIDANLPSSPSCAAAAVNVTGKHILISMVRVKNYGNSFGGIDCTVISPARASSACPVPPYDCIIDDCVVDAPSTNHSQTATLLALLTASSSGTNYFHEACVFRNNYLEGGYTTLSGPQITAISADGARGTIVENNRIVNCRHGGPRQLSTDVIQDLVVRDNFYSNVQYGIALTSYNAVGRIIIEDNLIDLAPFIGTFGITLEGQSTAPPNWSFDVVVIRGNRVRAVEGQVPVDPSNGIKVTRANRLTIENNIIDSPPSAPDYAVRITDCVSAHVFNNRRINGDLARVLNTNTGLYVPELTTDAEDVLLSL